MTFALPFLRGSGQMLFQASALTGGMFLILILSQSRAAFVACVAGIAGSTLCAYAMEHPGKAYFQGEGGFNGGLLGLALSLFYDFDLPLLLLAFAGGVLTGAVRVGLLRLLPVPPFTAPFVAVAWPAFGAAELMDFASRKMPVIDPWPLYAVATNASQVLFLLQPWVGMLVFAAVWLHSRTAAAWVFAASLMAWITAFLLGLPADVTATGLFGYNALILAAALQQRDTRRLLFMAGVVLSVYLTSVCWGAGVTPLSAPFVLSAWLVIAVEKVLDRRSTTAS